MSRSSSRKKSISVNADVRQMFANQQTNLVTESIPNSVLSPPFSQKAARSQIACSDFGPLRNIVRRSKGVFFCHECDLWDSLPPDIMKRCKRASQKHACRANHRSFNSPTLLNNWSGHARHGYSVRKKKGVKKRKSSTLK